MAYVAAMDPRTPSQERWLDVRRYLQSHRHPLAAAAADGYPVGARVAGTPLLAPPTWTPQQPLALQDIQLSWRPESTSSAVRPAELPLRPDGSRYQAYSEVVRDLAAPSVFENRSTYRLRSADLTADQPLLSFSTGSYFDGIDVGEAAAHELAAHQLDPSSGTPLRAAVGDPWDLGRRPANLAISCLTVRFDARTGSLRVPLHWRDPAKVGHAGGLYQVMPVGIFQAVSDRPADRENDFSLWHCLLRESAEELLGADEEHSADGQPLDYGRWPFGARMSAARRDGTIRVHCLGMGVNPLTFATDLLVTMVLDAEVYDEIFADVVATNAEGRSITAEEGAGADGLIGLDAASVRHYADDVPMQAAGAATLKLAWQHREALFG